jgi:serine/threonine protein kinase/Tol biopolymer transport system component
MTPERWQQIRDVLEKAFELAPGQRSAFLDGACLSDPSLRQEVETLLASSEDVRSSFLQSSALRVTITPGTKLGEYEVKSLLGSGGMGEVYRARDSRLGRDVAIKVLPSFLSADSERLRRFEQEARAAAALNHPNILAVHQMGTYQGAPYLVSELLEGETLREQIKRGRLPIRKAIDYGVQIARGLAAAHEKGIVHRDLKPENLFVTKDGRVKILDFGLAKLTQAGSENSADTLTKGTEAGMVMGTVGYMAPEQVRGQTADHRADIFAFGAILYEMLAGKRAFQKPTSAETMTAILNEDPPGISQVTTNLPPALQRVVHRCLEKNPEQRFQSASDLAFALDALSEGAGSATVYPGKGAGRTSFIKQHKLLSIAAGFVLVGLMVGVGWYFTRGLRSSNVAHAKITHKQFTFTGDAYSPAISPDGLFVAYISRKLGEPEKLIVQASNGTKVELAQGPILGIPKWSPDGSELLFSKYEPPLDKTDQAAKRSGTYVVSRLGGVARPLPVRGRACWLTPDGSQIVVAYGAVESGFYGFRIVNKQSDVVKEFHLSEYTYLLNLDCSSSAGLVLAVTQASDKYQIRTFKPDGSDEQKLLEESDRIYSARWSPTGDAIYYLHGKGSTKQLSKLSVTRRGTEPALVADGLQCGGSFSLSADGSRLAYTREDDNSNLWRVDLHSAERGTKPEISQLTSGTSYYGEPSFSPDGHWIVFALGPNLYETNIFKRPVLGGDPVQLTFFEHAASASPAWSPDGQRIAFIGNQSGVPRVWMISANGGAAQVLENTNASDTNYKLTWWPSSDIIYQQSGQRNYLQINDKTHEEKTIIQADPSLGWVWSKPVSSPDDKKIAFNWNRNGDGLWIVSVEPYSETLLLRGDSVPVGWSPDGKYVYAIRRELGRAREIIRVQVAAPNEVTSVAILPGDVVDFGGASVSPDGRKIFANVGEEKSDVWLMENFDPSPR